MTHVLTDAAQVKYESDLRNVYYSDSSGSIKFFKSYVEKRIEPALIYNFGNADIVQGQYKWGANCSHLLYDVISDYLVAKSIFGINKIKINPFPLSSKILEAMGADIVDGKRFEEKIINPGDQGLHYIENPWRHNGLKHTYISRLVRDILSVYSVPVESVSKNVVIVRRKKSPAYGFEYSRNIFEVNDFILRLSDNLGVKFDAVDLEDYSFQEQIGIFSNANYIVSVHGSALVWLNFCKSGTNVIEILTPYFRKDNWVKPDFWYISQQNALHHVPLYVDNLVGNASSPYDHDVIVSPTLVCDLIKQNYSK